MNEWDDPDIKKLLMDLRASIDAYRHIKKKISDPLASGCKVVLEDPAESFTAPEVEANRSDRLFTVIGSLPGLPAPDSAGQSDPCIPPASRSSVEVVGSDRPAASGPPLKVSRYTRIGVAVGY